MIMNLYLICVVAPSWMKKVFGFLVIARRKRLRSHGIEYLNALKVISFPDPVRWSLCFFFIFQSAIEIFISEAWLRMP